MDDNQQEFFEYMLEEHGLPTLESDYSNVMHILEKVFNPIIERAFIAGRSQTSWEQFKKDNDLI